jgi:hypothetical protein
MKYEPNKIKVDVGSYRHYWRGVKKIGKTTMFRDLVIYTYGNSKYGFVIAPGNESGFKALDNIYAQETPTWQDFVLVVDDLVENKQDNEFKLIGIDTVDELVSIAIKQTIKVHFQRKNERVDTINSALGGYGNGPAYVQTIINDQIKRLEGAGYGLVFIGHTKIRDVKEKNMDEAYQQLTSNLESRYDSIFSDKADIIATFYQDKNVKDKELIGVERFIYFRTDGFVDAGSRFSNMPERVPMTPADYLKAFEQGVKSSFSTQVTSDDIAKIRKQELEAREQKASDFIEKEKTGDAELADDLVTVEDYRNAITNCLASLDSGTKKQKQADLKDQGIPSNYKTQEDIEVLKSVLKIVSRN